MDLDSLSPPAATPSRPAQRGPGRPPGLTTLAMAHRPRADSVPPAADQARLTEWVTTESRSSRRTGKQRTNLASNSRTSSSGYNSDSNQDGRHRNSFSVLRTDMDEDALSSNGNDRDDDADNSFTGSKRKRSNTPPQQDARTHGEAHADDARIEAAVLTLPPSTSTSTSGARTPRGSQPDPSELSSLARSEPHNPSLTS